MKKILSIILAILTVLMSFDGMDVSAAGKNDTTFDNTWQALQLDFQTVLLNGILPNQAAPKTAPTKRIRRINFSYSTWNGPQTYYLFKYDAKNRLKKLEEYSRGSESSDFYQSFAYQYSYSGGQLSGYQYSVQKKSVSTATIDTDSKGRIVAFHTHHKKTDFEEDTTIKYKNGNITKLVSHNNNEEQYEPFTHTYTYNGNGRIASYQAKGMTTGRVSIRYDFRYDEQGNITSAIETRSNSDKPVIHEISYDADGYISRITKTTSGADYSMYTDILYQ